MSRSGSLDDRTPVIVGVGQHNQRVDRGEPSLEPVELMLTALRAAADDAGDPGIVAKADSVRSVNVFGWRYRDPARLVATALGCDGATTAYTHIGGNVPQMVVNGACRDLASGDAEIVLVTGAEAASSKAQMRRAGVSPDWTVQDDSVEPDAWLDADVPLFMESELSRGVVMPIQIYPLFESAWRAANGWTIDENRRRIAELASRMSQVAAANPHAWNRVAYTPEQIDSPDDHNRMVGFPYRKLVNSYERVDQGAGLIITTVATARSLGLDDDRWVFPLSGTDGGDTTFTSNRPTFAGSPAMRIAGRLSLELAGVEAAELTTVDLYSCFPVAVQIAAHELGLRDDRDLTVTGGLPFAGGPWSNYVSHSIATTVEELRTKRGSGLVSANGGYFTKHAFGVYSTEPSGRRYAWAKPQDEIDAVGSIPVDDDYDGDATVESCTVMHDRDGAPERGIITARTPAGARAWGTSTDPDTMARIEADETVGTSARIASDGAFVFV
ncbi:MAG TPA: acetyl-CoA acetyltransferase [Acidimicrobiales bacterium]|nr:acetyl-CoA acetyltransferase [Acidimicrobiales bacterium]